MRLTALRPALQSELNRRFNQVFTPDIPIKLERDFAASYDRANLSNACVALDGRKLAAHAVAKPVDLRMHGCALKWASYGNVMTLDAYRGKGIASRINARLWAKMKREGVDGIFISGGRGLYTRVGATPSGDYFRHWVKPSQLSKLAGLGKLELRLCAPKDLPALLQLQNAETVGFRRHERDFRGPLKDGVAFLGPARAWLFSSGGGPLAYVVLGPSWNERKLRRWRYANIVDYAGDRAALLAGLGLLLKRGRRKGAELLVAASDASLRFLLEGCGSKGKWRDSHGTHLLLHPARLIRRLVPWFEARLGADAARLRFSTSGKGFQFRLGSSSHKLKDLQALTRLLMGQKPSAWKASLPKSGALRRALENIFPLPFPIIGLNWN